MRGSAVFAKDVLDLVTFSESVDSLFCNSVNAFRQKNEAFISAKQTNIASVRYKRDLCPRSILRRRPHEKSCRMVGSAPPMLREFV